MNVGIFWVRVMKCMCARTWPQFILSSEGVFGGMEFEPMLTPREKSPLPENVPRGGSNPQRCGQRAQALPTSYSSLWPSNDTDLVFVSTDLLSVSNTALTWLISSHWRHTARRQWHHWGFVGWLVAYRPSNMLVYLRDRSAQTIWRAATLEIEAADPTFYLTQSQYTDTGPTSPSADPITPGAWQGSHWSANF